MRRCTRAGKAVHPAQLRRGAVHPPGSHRRSPRLPGLTVRPPDVHRYVVRVKPAVLKAFAESTGLQALSPARTGRRVRVAQFLQTERHVLTPRWATSAPSCCRTAAISWSSRSWATRANVEYTSCKISAPRLDLPISATDKRPRMAPRWPRTRRGLNGRWWHNGDSPTPFGVRVPAPSAISSSSSSLTPRCRCSSSICGTRVYKYPLEYNHRALARPPELDFRPAPPEKRGLPSDCQAHPHPCSPDVPGSSSSRANHPDRNACSCSAHRHGDVAAAGVRPGRQRRGADTASSVRRSRPSTPPCAAWRAKIRASAGRRQVLERARRQQQAMAALCLHHQRRKTGKKN